MRCELRLIPNLRKCAVGLGLIFFAAWFIGGLNAYAQIADSFPSPKESHAFRVGAATSKITPPIGSIMGNSYLGGNYFTADFPGKISALVAKAQGEDVVTLFTNGTSGNINHIDVTQPSQLSANKESALIGTILAADVLKVLSTMQPKEVGALKARTTKVELPIPSVQPQEVDWALEVIRQYGKSTTLPFSDVVKAWRILDLEDLGNGTRSHPTTTVPLTNNGKALQIEVQAVTLGDEIALVGFPGDAFVELGLGIKLNSPFPFTVVSEQSGNGTLSYVPNRKAFSEGGYEVNSARFSPGGGELLVDAVIETLIDLFPYKLNEK